LGAIAAEVGPMVPSPTCSPLLRSSSFWSSSNRTSTAISWTTCCTMGWLSFPLTPMVGISLFSSHLSTELVVDRAYRNVVSFASSPAEVPEIVNTLLSNRTNLAIRAEEGRRWIETKVLPHMHFCCPSQYILQISTREICEPLRSLLHNVDPPA
jgi:hypothetical protein